jgi:arylsulfatase A-like enzyme
MRFKSTTVMLFLCGIGSLVASEQNPGTGDHDSPATQANLLIITADDMNADSSGWIGGTLGATPHLDAFAKTAHRFVNSHVTVPICQPGRSALMTGRVPHRNGALGFNPIHPDVPTLVEILRQRGYYTAAIAKTAHMTPAEKFPWHDVAEQGLAKQPAKFAEKFRQMLSASTQRKQPFFINANIGDPHRPFINGVGKKGQADESLVGVRRYQSEDVAVPAFLEDIPLVRDEFAQYATSVSRFDVAFGLLMRELVAAGRDEDTIVLFMSDHGMSFPFSKATVYRNGTWSPVLIRIPGMKEPQLRTEFVSSVDVMPTLLELLNVPAPDGMDGRSWVPLLNGETQPDRDFVVTHVNTVSSGKRFAQRCIRTKDRALMFHAWVGGPHRFRVEAMNGLSFAAMNDSTDENLRSRVKQLVEGEPLMLFDTQADPSERANLIKDPGRAGEIATLGAKLLAHMQRTKDPETEAFEAALSALGSDGKPEVVRADVVIAGGSTAALAAALAAAENEATVVLIEPTDWIGGQLTSSGVPAIDEAWHKIKDPQSGSTILDVSRIARDPRNMQPQWLKMLTAIGNPGRGWVSRFCFEPKRLLNDHLLPWEERLKGKLVVYRETVVKRLQRDPVSGRIGSVDAIQRIVRPGILHRGYDRLPSQDLADWYAETPSDRFEKRLIRFEAPVFVDGTEWGELMPLANVSYLQGVDVTDGALEGNDRSGQSTVFGFVQKLHAGPVEDSATPANVEGMGLGSYQEKANAWKQIWTYRRLLGHGEGPQVGDLSLQNWGYSTTHGHGGNDYPFGYVFLNKEQTAQSLADWRGGVDLQVLAAAEQRAFSWHRWFKHAAPEGINPTHLALEPSVLGTGHGLAKLPYIRDTRRAIGLDDFVLKIADLIGEPGASQARAFEDTIAIGCYPADVHPLAGVSYPPHILEHYDTRPFNIPFRALTHREVPNLLVAGKTMAQSFMANSATRLHPIEWSTGTAAGVIAAWMGQRRASTRDAQANFAEVQAAVARRTPIRWQIDSP